MSGLGERPDAIDYAGHIDGMSPALPLTGVRSKYDEKLFGNLSELFERDQQHKLGYAFDWELYQLYLKGDQLIVRNRDTNELIELSVEDSKRLYSIHNILRPVTRAFVAKMTRQIPGAFAFPGTTDWDEQHSAQVANAFLEQVRRKDKLDLLYQDAVEITAWGGNAFFQPCWNPRKGRRITWCEVCDTVEIGWERDESGSAPLCGTCESQREQELQIQQQQAQNQRMALEFSVAAQLGAVPSPDMAPLDELAALEPPAIQQQGPLPPEQDPPRMQHTWEGDIEIKLHSPQNVFVDSSATCIEDAGHITVETLRRPEEVRQMFPHMAHLIPSEDPHIDTDEMRRFTVGNDLDTYSRNQQGMLILRETHEVPTPVYPEGRIIWWLSTGLILKEISSPYYWMFDGGRLPFFHFRGDINDGEFWAEPLIKNAWHCQREYNENRTHIREHIVLLLKPKWLIPIGSRIAQDEITATSAQLIKANLAGAGRPEIMQSPQVPPDVYGRNNELYGDVRTTFGVTEQELGISQSDPNARAAAILEAESSQTIGPMLRRNNSEFLEMYRLILMICQEFYDEERVATVVGDEGLQTFQWKDMNLSPGWDVQLSAVDGLSTNPAIRRQQAMEMMQAGRYTDPTTGLPNWREFDREAGLNTHKSGYDTEATEFAHAQGIPELLKRGVPVQPSPEDDPHIHAEVMLGWLRGPGRQLAQFNPQVVEQVRQLWMLYTFWAMTGEFPGQPLSAGAQPSQPGSDMSAPGGTPNNPGARPSDSFDGGSGSGRGSAEDAESIVRQADQRGEQLVQQGIRREG